MSTKELMFLVVQESRHSITHFEEVWVEEWVQGIEMLVQRKGCCFLGCTEYCKCLFLYLYLYEDVMGGCFFFDAPCRCCWRGLRPEIESQEGALYQRTTVHNVSGWKYKYFHVEIQIHCILVEIQIQCILAEIQIHSKCAFWG